MSSISEDIDRKISVIGLGAMGSAIANAFISKRQEVTIWNRDPSKAVPLTGKGATLAESVAAAVRSSPVIVICLTDCEVVNSLLRSQDVVGSLAGKIVLQLSSGTPNEQRSLAAWIRSKHGHCLQGNIMAWPRQMGTDEAMITICGPEETYLQIQSLPGLLAGTVSYMGPDDGASAALTSAGLAYLSATWIGFCYGALICEAEGLPVDQFGMMIESLAPVLGQETMRMGKVIHDNNFAGPETTLERAGTDVAIMLRHMQQAGLDPGFATLAARLLEQSGRAGYAKEEVAAMIKVMRAASRRV